MVTSLGCRTRPRSRLPRGANGAASMTISRVVVERAARSQVAVDVPRAGIVGELEDRLPELVERARHRLCGELL